MTTFIKVTSSHNTPIYFRRDRVLTVEGFTFAEDHPRYPNHQGCRLELTNGGQWTSTIHCTETAERVFQLVSGQTIQDLARGTERPNLAPTVISMAVGDGVSFSITSDNMFVVEDPFVRMSLGLFTKPRARDMVEYIQRLFIHAVES